MLIETGDWRGKPAVWELVPGCGQAFRLGVVECLALEHLIGEEALVHDQTPCHKCISKYRHVVTWS